MGGVKPFSERERGLYAQIRRVPEQTAYAMWMRDRWVRNFEGGLRRPQRGPASDQALYIDYLHYTRSGNNVLPGATYDSLSRLIEARIRTSRMARDLN